MGNVKEQRLYQKYGWNGYEQFLGTIVIIQLQEMSLPLLLLHKVMYIAYICIL